MIGISTDFAARGLAVRLACIEANVAVGPSDAGLAAALDQAAEELPARLAETPIADLPAIAATRRAYRALGKDPARYRPAAEALMRRIKQGKGLYRVNNVVDVNNLLSLRTGFSIGTYDLDRIEPPVVFRRAGAGESYAGIGRGPLNLEGLPVFADTAGPFGSPTSDSERTMVGEAARRILMVIIGFDAGEDPGDAAKRARDLLRAHCGASDATVTLRSRERD